VGNVEIPTPNDGVGRGYGQGKGYGASEGNNVDGAGGVGGEVVVVERVELLVKVVWDMVRVVVLGLG